MTGGGELGDVKSSRLLEVREDGTDSRGATEADVRPREGVGCRSSVRSSEHTVTHIVYRGSCAAHIVSCLQDLKDCRASLRVLKKHGG